MADASVAAAQAAAENKALCRTYIAVGGGRTGESDDESYIDGVSDGSASARDPMMARMAASSSSGSEAGAATTNDRVVTLQRDVDKRAPGYFDELTDEEKEFADVLEPSSMPDPVLGAARDGDATRVAALLAQGCSRGGQSWRRRGAMHLAARRGSVGTVATLMGYGCNANAGGDIYGHTPLHLAARAGHLPVVRVLVDADVALLGVSNLFGDEPLHVAVRNGQTGVTSFLLARGASALRANNHAESTMTLAGPVSSAMGRTDAKRVMGDAHTSGSVLAHALVQATWYGRGDWVRALLHAGARQDVAVVEEEDSAMEAGMFGLDPTRIVVTLVLVGGCSVRPSPPLPLPDDRADAPLNALARRGREKDLAAMIILLTAGADANYRDKVPLRHLFTPLENAAFVGRNAAMVKIPLEHQAGVHAVGGPEQRTVLHWVAVGMRPGICGPLIDAGADVWKRDGA